MTLIRSWTVLQTLALLLFSPENSFAGPRIIGTPPNFTEQPSDTVVLVSALQDFNGSMVNLVLRCGVTGDPAPTVTWFRGSTDITAMGITPGDGSIGLNVTEGEEGGASRDGTLYHCRATNTIGLNNATVTIRSRNASVSYAFFGGFRDLPGDVTVSTVVPGSVALECAVDTSNPPPVIEWYRAEDNGQLGSQVALSNSAPYVELVQDGRYLYFSTIMSADTTNIRYTCAVTNARITETIASGRFYTIMGNLADNTGANFLLLDRSEIATIGEVLVLHISAAYAATSNSERYDAQCETDTGIELTGISTRVTYTVPDPPTVSTITCIGRGGNTVLFTTVLNLTYVKPPMITTSSSPEELVRRDIIAGGPTEVLRCDSSGIPTPTVTWFYNGNLIYGTMNNATVNSAQVTISNPQPSSSGVYQCFVSNSVSAPFADIQRIFIVEVTEPVAPFFTDLVNTIAGSVSDRIEGTLLVLPLDTMNVLVTAQVFSNPCPSVQWQFNGTNISTGDPLFTFNDPCANDANFSPYQFNLTITNLTMVTSGGYSAVFDNQRFSSAQTLPPLYVTIPVPQNPLAVNLQVRNNAGIQCLLAGSTVVLTCDLEGFPRPSVEFFFGNERIVPALQPRFSNISFDQIEIMFIQREDQGAYSCRTDSTFSSQSTEFIYCTKPNVVNITSDVNVKEGDKLDIVCRVDGFPIPSVVWFKDDVKIQSQGDNIRISTTEDDKSSIVFISSASPANNGVYTCMATNDAGSANRTIQIQVKEQSTGLQTSAIIGIAAGGAGLILVIVLLILLLICVFLCAKRTSKSQSVDFHPYNVDSTPADDYKDGRGNVDADSVDGNMPPEAFEPDYASLPTTRPHEPPPYKAAPGYGHGGPLEGDDLEMVKYPPQDIESYMGYSRQQDQYRPTPDDFLSEDAQFV